MDGVPDGADPCPVDDSRVAFVQGGEVPAGCPANLHAGRFDADLAGFEPIRFGRNSELRRSSEPVARELALLQQKLPGSYRLVVNAPEGSEAWFLERADVLLDALVRDGADPDRLDPDAVFGPPSSNGAVFWLQRVPEPSDEAAAP